jgi:predicted O-methyltransferase YrrM
MIQTKKLESFCSEFGVDLEKVRARLIEIGLQGYVNGPNSPTGKPYFCFAIASLIMPNMKNILELGTGLGESTSVLSKLFPRAIIYTIDLPKSDKKHKKWRYFKPQGIERFNVNTNETNIKFIERDTFFLWIMELPSQFDLIFVDGGHWFPVVAWDIMYSYGHLAPGGFMLMHDYTDKPNTTHVKNVIDYIEDLIEEDIYLLPMDSLRPINEGKLAWIQRKK